MKARILFMACLFIGIVTMSAQAQDKAQSAVQGWVMSTYWSPVYCGDEMVDELQGGEIRMHYVYRYKKGVFFKEIDQIKGTVQSQSGEVFKIREVDKTYFTDHWYISWHYNLIGDQGNHYIGTLTYSYFTGEITVGKTVCN